MNPSQIATAYYDAFLDASRFADVPFSADVRFHSPSGTTEGAESLRAALVALSQNVKGLAMRHQLTEGEDVLSVYDFDMGLPGGAIPMAERLRCVAGEIVEAELFFDTKRLGG